MENTSNKLPAVKEMFDITEKSLNNMVRVTEFNFNVLNFLVHRLDAVESVARDSISWIESNYGTGAEEKTKEWKKALEWELPEVAPEGPKEGEIVQ